MTHCDHKVTFIFSNKILAGWGGNTSHPHPKSFSLNDWYSVILMSKLNSNLTVWMLQLESRQTKQHFVFRVLSDFGHSMQTLASVFSSQLSIAIGCCSPYASWFNVFFIQIWYSAWFYLLWHQAMHFCQQNCFWFDIFFFSDQFLNLREEEMPWKSK